MVLFEKSHVRTRIGGMNRRKERVPYAHPSCCAQRTRLNVHRTLARVQLCVKTLQMTMTIRQREAMKQHVGSTCPVTVVLSNRQRWFQGSRLMLPRPSAAAILRPFSLKCRHVLQDRDRVKSGSTAHDGCAKSPSKY